MLPILASLIPTIVSKGIDLFDKKFETDSDKLKAKQQYEMEINALMQNFELQIQQQITERHKSDMSSDSWLSKNIRPLTLVYLMVLFTVAFITDVPPTVLEMLRDLLMTVFGFYFVARGIEKVTSIIKGGEAK